LYRGLGNALGNKMHASQMKKTGRDPHLAPDLEYWLASHPGGAEVVFDYGEPRDRIDPVHRPQYEERAARVAAIGEPFLSYFDPDELHDELRTLGFERIDDLDVPLILMRLLGGAADSEVVPRAALARRSGHVLFAAT
jgi:hypothetical protein